MIKIRLLLIPSGCDGLSSVAPRKDCAAFFYFAPSTELFRHDACGEYVMKTPTAAKRRARRSPWSAKNFKLLRSALRVWELKQRSMGNWW